MPSNSGKLLSVPSQTQKHTLITEGLYRGLLIILCIHVEEFLSKHFPRL